MKPSTIFSIHLPLVLLLTSCSSSGIRMSREAQTQSLATAPLVEKVKSEIALTENTQKGNCGSPVIRRVVRHSSARGRSGDIIAAREDWILDRCGRNIIYQVDFYGPISETTNIHVKQLNH